MSKTWILIGLLFQLILILWVYYLLKTEPRKSLEGSRIDAQVTSARKEAFTNPQLTQLKTKEIKWKDIPRKPSPPADEMHEKWIVVTTINSPTADVKKLAGIEGWKVVVVGDTKTPADWRYIYI